VFRRHASRHLPRGERRYEKPNPGPIGRYGAWNVRRGTAETSRSDPPRSGPLRRDLAGARSARTAATPTVAAEGIGEAIAAVTAAVTAGAAEAAKTVR